MSFSLTTEQCRNKSKTVTRRIGWSNLKRGDRVQQVEKGQGLKKGERVKKIHVIECVSNRREAIGQMLDPEYGRKECALEGFAGTSGLWFVSMFCNHNKCSTWKIVNRIEFRYVT